MLLVPHALDANDAGVAVEADLHVRGLDSGHLTFKLELLFVLVNTDTIGTPEGPTGAAGGWKDATRAREGGDPAR